MKVSIVTTCFNAENCIEKTIRSVLSQTYKDFEYIIMDGGSTDNTVSIAKLYEKKFEAAGITFKVYSQKDKGIYDGMNNGVSHAEGEFINFMNADDEFFDKNVLEEIFGGSKGELYLDAGIIYGDAAELEFGTYYLFTKNYENILKRMPFSHQSVFARRELLTRYPFNLQYKIAGDYDFLINCYDEGVKFVDSKVMICAVSKDGLSSVKLYDTFLETENMLKSHGHPRYSEGQLKKKLLGLKIRQFGMDYLPGFVKEIIRNFQRKTRGQNKIINRPEV